ncbi:MAG: hypothetical protein KatS3mg111_1578 [Pirellulaceae bacterium]|nr:MAG: hypothetical protein KatS3mg111_1578 [Pirellulaceae bacterium]
MKTLGLCLITIGIVLCAKVAVPQSGSNEWRGCLDDYDLNICENICPVNRPNCSKVVPPGCDPCKK